MISSGLRALRAYLSAIAVFVVLHFALMALVDFVAESPDRIQAWMPYLNVLAYALYALVGFVAGAIERRHNVLNGAIAGILAVAVAVLAFGATAGFELGTLVLFFNGAVIGGIGGTFSMVLGERKAAAEQNENQRTDT